MIFHSLGYIGFLAIVFAIYWSLGTRAQNRLLLLGSWFFYGAAHPVYLSLLLAVTLTDYSSARLIVLKPHRKRLFLIVSLLVDFGLLCVFKYFGFFSENVVALLRTLGWNAGELTFQILLPVGISFYVFQSSAYVIDTYRGRVQPTDDFFDYALFVSFFPQLVAGPIERASHLLGILQSSRRIDAARFQGAFLLLLWGFFLKLVIADNAAAICNRLYSIEATQFPLLWAGVFAFGVQIYADFWAYTTIARGSARLLGIDLVHNFDHPYSATSPAEFWRRWHISLSTWFRDYVYIPLGGSRGGIAMECRNLLATFALSGLWHGASWNFIIWGIYHGILVSGERLLENRGWLKNRSTNGWIPMGKWLATFVLIHIGWLFFREHNSDYLWRYLRLDPFDGPTLLHWQGGLQEVLVVGVYALPLWLAPVAQSWWERSGQWRIGQLPGIGQFSLTLAAALGLFVLILILGNDVSSDFIYFQF